MSNPFIDLKMTYNEELGCHDLVVSASGSLEADFSFDTVIANAIKTDGRADKSEVPDVALQRGTIVDLYTNKPNGSKLWLLKQARTDTNSKNKAVDFVKNALKFLKEEGFVEDIYVDASLTSKGIALYVTIKTIRGTFNKYRVDAWNNSVYRVS